MESPRPPDMPYKEVCFSSSWRAVLGTRVQLQPRAGWGASSPLLGYFGTWRRHPFLGTISPVTVSKCFLHLTATGENSSASCRRQPAFSSQRLLSLDFSSGILFGPSTSTAGIWARGTLCPLAGKVVGSGTSSLTSIPCSEASVTGERFSVGSWPPCRRKWEKMWRSWSSHGSMWRRRRRARKPPFRGTSEDMPLHTSPVLHFPRSRHTAC